MIIEVSFERGTGDSVQQHLMFGTLHHRDSDWGLPDTREDGRDVGEGALPGEIHKIAVHNVGGLETIGLKGTQWGHVGEVLEFNDHIKDTHGNTCCAPVGSQEANRDWDQKGAHLTQHFKSDNNCWDSFGCRATNWSGANYCVDALIYKSLED
jgi:hypothetical protein